MNELTLNIIKSLPNTITQLVMIFACIYYLVKKTSLDGILLTIGSILGFLVMVFHSIIMTYLLKEKLIDPLYELDKVLMQVGIVGFISAVIFTVGFVMLIINTVKYIGATSQTDTIDKRIKVIA
jgi:energy-coupling factor transporter transmembrane protein EcfT